MKNKIIIGLTFGVLGLMVLSLQLLPGNGGQDSEGRVLGAKTEAAEIIGGLPNIAGFTKPPVKINDSEPGVAVKAAILVDAESAYPLYQENEQASVPIASVTKVMTAMVVLDNYNLEDEIIVSSNAVGTIGSSIHLKTDEVITVEALLKGLLIQSGNDAAVALAEKMGLEKFIDAMNNKARSLGMTSTVYRDPAGLDDEARSTAKDLATLATYALRHPKIKEIVSTQTETVFSIDGQISHDLKNSNRLIRQDHPLYLAEAYGLKTGFTPEAGHCLVSSAGRDGHELISVILNTDEQTVEASAKESRKLLVWGLENFQW